MTACLKPRERPSRASARRTRGNEPVVFTGGSTSMADARRKQRRADSGRGSNLAALIGAARDPDYPARSPSSSATTPMRPAWTMRASGRSQQIVDRKGYASKLEFEIALDDALHIAGSDLVCLAGFMRLLSPEFVDAWRDRMLNIHPSLLPPFPASNTHERALAAGVRLHGATCISSGAKRIAGRSCAQGAVPVLAEDGRKARRRVLPVEHRLYPLALKLVASGRAGRSESG